MQNITLDDIQGFMHEICATWVNQLDIKITVVHEKSAEFIWVAGDDLCRIVDDGTKIVSGQATMAVADTASFMTICGLHDRFVNCTTVDMSTNFMRPIFAGEINITMTALSLGRKLMTIRAEFSQNGKIAASATGVFAHLD